MPLAGLVMKPSDSAKLIPSVNESCESTGQMSLFGMTCERLMPRDLDPLLPTPNASPTAGSGANPLARGRKLHAEALTSSPVAIPASHSQSPGSDWARKMTATYGRRLGDWYLKSGPADACLRMLLDTSAWASTTCYLTWKKSVTPQGRLLFRLVPSTPRTAGIGSGLLHTPTVTANQESPSMVNRDPGSWRLWGTPQERSYKDTPGANVPEAGYLAKQVYNTEKGGKLNSAWVSRMMGYPDDWLTLDGEETP